MRLSFLKGKKGSLLFYPAVKSGAYRLIFHSGYTRYLDLHIDRFAQSIRRVFHRQPRAAARPYIRRTFGTRLCPCPGPKNGEAATIYLLDSLTLPVRARIDSQKANDSYKESRSLSVCLSFLRWLTTVHDELNVKFILPQGLRVLQIFASLSCQPRSWPQGTGGWIAPP